MITSASKVFSGLYAGAEHRVAVRSSGSAPHRLLPKADSFGAIVICVVASLVLARHGVAQASQAVRYPFENIPIFEVPVANGKPGQVDFGILPPTDRAGGAFYMQDVQGVKGSITLSKDGHFTYDPDPSDRQDFAIPIEYKADGQVTNKELVITFPTVALPSEYDSLPRQVTLPKASDRSYKLIDEIHVPKTASDGTTTRDMRKVILSGKELVFDKDNDLETLVQERDDVLELDIYAETLTFRDRVTIPGADVKIYARHLIFSDQNPERVAALVVTPSKPTPQKQEGAKGADGLNGPSVSIMVGDLTLNAAEESNARTHTRIAVEGGAGQDPGAGHDGAAGANMPVIRSPACVAIGYVDGNNSVTHYDGTNAWPDGGPAAPAGKPGTGGRGGTIVSNLQQVLDLSSVAGGSSGKKDRVYNGGSPGNPAVSTHEFFPDRNSIFGAGTSAQGMLNRLTQARSLNQSHQAVKGPDADSPPPDKVAGEPGEKRPVLSQNKLPWIRPEILCHALNYASDCYRQGSPEVTRAILTNYCDLLQPSSSLDVSDNDLTEFLLQAHMMLTRIAGGLDFYGYPPDWAPLVSFDYDATTFKAELSDSVELLYLCCEVQSVSKQKEISLETLAYTRDDLRATQARLFSEYDAVQKELPDLDRRMTENETAADQMANAIEAEKSKLLAQAQQNLQPSTLQIGLTMLSAAVRCFPVVGKYLGGVADTLADVRNLSQKDLGTTLSDAREAYENLSSLANDKVKKAIKDDLSKMELDDHAKFKENLEKAFKDAEMFGQAVLRVREATKALEVPQDALEKEFARLEAQSPELKSLVGKVQKITAERQVLTEAILQLNQQLLDLDGRLISTKVSLEQTASLIEQRALSVDRDLLSFYQQLQRQVAESLDRYEYFIAKAYEYRYLRPYPQFRSVEDLVDKTDNVLKSFVNEPSPPQLNDEKRKELESLYLRNVRAVTFEIKERAQTSVPTFSREVAIGLTSDELSVLNQSGKVDIDLSSMLPLYLNAENLRIETIEVDGEPDETEVQLANLPAGEDTANLFINRSKPRYGDCRMLGSVWRRNGLRLRPRIGVAATVIRAISDRR